MEEKHSNIDLFNSCYFLSRIYYETSDHEKCIEFKKNALNLDLTSREKEILKKRLECLNDLKFR